MQDIIHFRGSLYKRIRTFLLFRITPKSTCSTRERMVIYYEKNPSRIIHLPF